MKITNTTTETMGFAQYVVVPGESCDVDATAYEWYTRHGCEGEKPKAPKPSALIDTLDAPSVPRRKRRPSK